MVRHPNLDWAVEEKFLRNNPKAIQTLRLMEESGGEPDLLQLDSGGLIFCDCSQESPALRRSLCYDNEALSLRKKSPPARQRNGPGKPDGFGTVDREPLPAIAGNRRI